MSEAGIEVLYYVSVTANASYPHGPSLADLRRNQTAFFSSGGVNNMISVSGSGKEEEVEGEGK